MQQVWLSEEHGTLHGVPFRYYDDGYDKLRTTAEEIVVLKRKFFFNAYRSLTAYGPVRRLLEVGVFQGGSALIFADMFPEAKIVGIDWGPGSPEIQAHIERMGYSDRIKLYWGVSQDDGPKIQSILREEYGDEPLDLVVDDCSHLYSYTTRSFDILYPRLRNGGVYAIEDWACVHKPGRYLPPYFFQEDKPLSQMLLELALGAANYPRRCEVVLTHAQSFVRKYGELPPFEQLAKPSSGQFQWAGFNLP